MADEGADAPNLSIETDDPEAAREALREMGERIAAEIVARHQPAEKPAPASRIPAEPMSSPAPEPVVVYDDRPVFDPLHLRHPFTIDGVRVATLLFREPSFADVEACVSGRISEHDLHARMAGVEVKVLRALKWSDSEIATLVARTIAPELRIR